MAGTTAFNFTEDQRLEILFSRASRRSERAVLPISSNARDASDASPAFYCVHSVSGTAGTDYADLASGFTQVKLYGVQAPPSKIRDPEFGRNIDDLAMYYAQDLVKFQPEGTFFLGGWSTGGIVALEIARNLLKRGRQVGLLVAIDTVPENTHLDARPSGLRNAWEVVCNFPRWVKSERMREKAKRAMLVRLSDLARQLAKAANRRMSDETGIRKHDVYKHVDISGFAPEHKHFVMKHYDSVLNRRFIDQYSGNVVVYKAKVQPLLHPSQVEYAWRKIATRIEIVSVDGTHSTLMLEPSANAIARDLEIRITQSVKEDRAPLP